MILRGARVAVDARAAVRMDVGIEADRVRLPAIGAGAPELDCSGLLVLPGLINAHDHLEFNLFPRLGIGPYPNATAWARDVYRPGESPVREHLLVPKRVRLLWGAMKNLICGATTVMHHNPYESAFEDSFPLRVVRHFGWAHSVAFAPDFAARHRATPPDLPFVLHAGEGTDRHAAAEAEVLDSNRVLTGNTVLVHGVAFDGATLSVLRQRSVALVWCPTSNHFNLGRTLSETALESGVPIALGSDSALTAAGDLADDVAEAAAIAGWERVYRMVTTGAAAILRLREGEGEIRHGGIANLVLVRDRGQSPAEALFHIRPEMVFVAGKLKLAAAHSSFIEHHSALTIEGRGSYRVACDISGALWAARQALGADIRLAGKRVAA